ncbi:unnamed protein product [Rhizophagus irregularis]|nr:unnamed protein product [Rhizophagus irregularis]
MFDISDSNSSDSEIEIEEATKLKEYLSQPYIKHESKMSDKTKESDKTKTPDKLDKFLAESLLTEVIRTHRLDRFQA